MAEEQSLEPIALAGRETLLNVFCVQPSEIDERRMSQWLEAAEVISHYCTNKIETSFTSLTQKAYHAYGRREWDTEPREAQLAWEAAVRHMVNIATAQDAEDLKEANTHNWKIWVASKLQEKEHENSAYR